ncbi:C40 family peptidase [Mucilaginibacter myungsuensis]|uniref:C40 family peptidase n=1 Tax=Mucilaginibacter myungsuensis TaxID=649104 RepID=A0A929KYE1_9SPHI|nr:NlpC/P60 family protein [Mucilaginibacter myungsuensis]MBE9662743.1 C40 family peptidase [Mucilaginibacter myungsuensis]MDN3598163.1 NlpC/P60 family protein [Mucilaginibacter myungsuensis]
MEYGICNLAIVPLRAEPTSRSEQVSQLLFGETFEIMEWQGEWARIITTMDGYEGWASGLQFVALSQKEYQALQNTVIPLTTLPVTQAWRIADNSIFYLPIGSSLSFLKGTTCHINNELFEIVGETVADKPMEDIARSFLNVPYHWGGRTHCGVDCSGFVQAIYRLQGISLKRDAYLQAEQGTVVNFIQEAQLGDLAFFDNAEGRINHVGLMLNNEQVIHASGKVRIDKIDNHGIYSAEAKKYTHNLRIIKRIV